MSDSYCVNLQLYAHLNISITATHVVVNEHQYSLHLIHGVIVQFMAFNIFQWMMCHEGFMRYRYFAELACLLLYDTSFFFYYSFVLLRVMFFSLCTYLSNGITSMSMIKYSKHVLKINYVFCIKCGYRILKVQILCMHGCLIQCILI